MFYTFWQFHVKFTLWRWCYSKKLRKGMQLISAPRFHGQQKWANRIQLWWSYPSMHSLLRCYQIQWINFCLTESKRSKACHFMWLRVITGNAIQSIDLPTEKKKKIKIYPIGGCDFPQNVRVIRQETNRLDPLIFKTGGKISSYYKTCSILVATQSSFTCSKVTIETLEQSVKYVQS